MIEFKVRPLRRGDRNTIFQLLKEEGYDVATSDQPTAVAWVVEHPETGTFVAVDPNDHLLGFISVSYRPALRAGGRIATIEAFFVHGEFREKALLQKLLDAALARADELGCRRVDIQLRERDKWLLELLDKSVFKQDAVTVYARVGKR
jgi:GNAT superfamily N-acetyltransferase